MDKKQSKNEIKRIVEKAPYSKEAEYSVLSCFMLNDELAETKLLLLDESDFYDTTHKLIFSCMKDIIVDGNKLDIVSLTDRLELKGLLDKVGGLPFISDLSTHVVSTVNYDQYKNIVKRDSTLRRIMLACKEINQDCLTTDNAEDTLKRAEKAIFDISESEATSSLVHTQEAADRVITKFERIKKNSKENMGILTTYKRLDDILLGLHKTDLMILAARPACGKTSFALNIATKVALRNGIVAVFSLEMSIDQLVQRTLCSIAEVDNKRALNGSIDLGEFKKLTDAKIALSKSSMYVDDSAITTPQDIISKCRKLKREKGGLDLVVVDYLQLMTTKKRTDNRQQEVSEISRSMKIAAKELDVPIILLSQLSRESEKRTDDPEPKLSDLRESGSIEQDADIVMFLYSAIKMESEAPLVNLYIAKHRNGETATIEFAFHKSYTTFKEVPKSEAELIKKNAIAADKANEKGNKKKKSAQEQENEKESVLVQGSAEVKENNNDYTNYDEDTIATTITKVDSAALNSIKFDDINEANDDNIGANQSEKLGF